MNLQINLVLCVGEVSTCKKNYVKCNKIKNRRKCAARSKSPHTPNGRRIHVMHCTSALVLKCIEARTRINVCWICHLLGNEQGACDQSCFRCYCILFLFLHFLPSLWNFLDFNARRSFTNRFFNATNASSPKIHSPLGIKQQQQQKKHQKHF